MPTTAIFTPCSSRPSGASCARASSCRARRARPRAAERLTLAYVPVRVLLDYRPALRQRTGVGEYIHRTALALAATARAGDRVAMFSSSWKDRLTSPDPGDRRLRRPGAGARPQPGLASARLARPSSGWPARPTSPTLRRPCLLPATRAAQVVTIHDLYFLDHPERDRGRDPARLPVPRRRARPPRRPRGDRVRHRRRAGGPAARRRSRASRHLPERRARLDTAGRRPARRAGPLRRHARAAEEHRRPARRLDAHGRGWPAACPCCSRAAPRPRRRRCSSACRARRWPASSATSATSRTTIGERSTTAPACWCCPRSTRASACPSSRP